MRPFLAALFLLTAGSLHLLGAGPTISSFAPNWVPYGDAESLVVAGSGFAPGATVYFGSSALPTTYVSASQLTGQLTASATSLPSGYATVTVKNPDGAQATFQVSMIPALTSLSPSSAPPTGAPNLAITINGNGFTPNNFVNFNCAGFVYQFAATYISSTALRFTLTDCTLRTGAQFEIGVGDNSTGARTFKFLEFTVTSAPSVAVSSISPASAPAGGAALTLTVLGFGFPFGAVVQWNGTALATTFVSSSQLTAIVPTNLLVAGTDHGRESRRRAYGRAAVCGDTASSLGKRRQPGAGRCGRVLRGLGFGFKLRTRRRRQLGRDSASDHVLQFDSSDRQRPCHPDGDRRTGNADREEFRWNAFVLLDNAGPAGPDRHYTRDGNRGRPRPGSHDDGRRLYPERHHPHYDGVRTERFGDAISEFDDLDSSGSRLGTRVAAVDPGID
jgi:hypothetical protein